MALGVFFVFFVSATVSAATVTLKECFDLAVKQNELLKIDQETILQLAAQRRATRALALPDIGWKWTNIRQDVSGITPGGSGSDRTNSQKSRTTSSFNAVQTIYAGLSELYAMSSLLSEKEREELLYQRTLDELYAQVARAYYGVISLELDLTNVRDSADLTSDRLKELKDRVRLGKSRRSEEITSQAQADDLLAEAIRLEGEIFRARQALSFLTGVDMSKTSLIDQFPASVKISLQDALSRSQKRSDILAFEADVDAKRKAIQVARAAFHPYADVEGNYYTQRPDGLLHESDWDLIFNVRMPLFQGGGAFAGTAEAKSRYRQAELSLARLKRAVNLDVTLALNLYESSVKEAATLNSAYKKAREVYQLHVREYRLGLVNNLDVLQSQNAMQELQHDLYRVLLQAKLSYIDVGLSMGEKL